MSEITILVAAYNAVDTLPKCLDSLCGQTLNDIEIIAVDDCSTDGTLALLQERAAKDVRIKVLQTLVNSGQAVARNLALEHATAPLVCMVDADDWLSPSALEQALEVFHEYPRTDCVAFRLVRIDEQGQEDEQPMPQPLGEGGSMTGSDAFEACMDGWRLHGLYVTRTALHRQYPFDTTTRLYSDDNTSRLHYFHSREVRACKGIYYYRQHPSSMTTGFNLHRFDFMEANLSLLFALNKENVSRQVLRRFEGGRWQTFISCYRLFLEHPHEINEEDTNALRQRFATILHTFRPSRLPLRYRWKPGYWLTLNTKLFDWQQRGYICLWQNGLKALFHKN